jgi:hypothetical protein
MMVLNGSVQLKTDALWSRLHAEWAKALKEKHDANVTLLEKLEAKRRKRLAERI